MDGAGGRTSRVVPSRRSGRVMSASQHRSRRGTSRRWRATASHTADLFSHLGPRGDRVRSHPEPKSCERQALALRDDGLKTALPAYTVERRDAVHSCKPKACRTRPELGPRRLLAQEEPAPHEVFRPAAGTSLDPRLEETCPGPRRGSSSKGVRSRSGRRAQVTGSGPARSPGLRHVAGWRRSDAARPLNLDGRPPPTAW